MEAHILQHQTHTANTTLVVVQPAKRGLSFCLGYPQKTLPNLNVFEPNASGNKWRPAALAFRISDPRAYTRSRFLGCKDTNITSHSIAH